MNLTEYKVGFIDGVWFDSVESEGDTIEILISNDGNTIISRSNTLNYLEFTEDEWKEIVLFVKNVRIDEGWDEPDGQISTEKSD